MKRIQREQTRRTRVAVTAVALAWASCTVPGQEAGTGNAYVDPDCTQTGNVCYVSLTGSDANKGTKAEPWGTLKHAFGRIQPGQTLYLKAGVYRQTESLGRGLSHAATSGQRITIAADPEAKSRPWISSLRSLQDTTKWTRWRGDIWYTSMVKDRKTQAGGSVPLASQDHRPLNLMNPVVDGKQIANGDPAALTGPGQWVRSMTQRRIYVWARGGGNPGQYRVEYTDFPGGGGDTISLHENPAADDTGEADYITFRGLGIEGGYYAMQINTDFVHIENCVIRNTYGDGLKVAGRIAEPGTTGYWNAVSGKLTNSTILHFGESAIDITGGDHWLIEGNVFRDSAHSRLKSPSNPHGSKNNGIMLKNNAVGIRVINNDFYRIHGHLGVMGIGGDVTNRNDGDKGPILVGAGNAVNTLVENNRFYDNTGNYVISFVDALDSQFINNVVQHNSVVSGIVRFKAAKDRAEHNTLRCTIRGNNFFQNTATTMHHLHAAANSVYVKGCTIAGNALPPAAHTTWASKYRYEGITYESRIGFRDRWNQETSPNVAVNKLSAPAANGLRRPL